MIPQIVLNEPFIIKFDPKLINLENISTSKIQESFEFRSTQSLDKTFMKYGVLLDEFIGRSFRHCTLAKPTFNFLDIRALENSKVNYLKPF